MPRPKPNLVFGYLKAAFTLNKQRAINFLIKNFCINYVMPIKSLIFLFLQLEFKCRTSSLLFVAKNQVVSTGTIAINALLELYKCILVEKNIDINILQYFSIIINQRIVCLDVD